MIQTIAAAKKEKTSLPFFGIPRIVPYARKYSRTLAISPCPSFSAMP